MVRRIRPLAGRASLAVSVMDILKLSLAPWNDGKLSARALRAQRTIDTLEIALPTRVGSGITAGAGIHYPVLRRILYPRGEFPCSGFKRQQARARLIEHQGVIVIMGNRQVSCAERELQRIDLCAGWHGDTRLRGRGDPNSDISEH